MDNAQLRTLHHKRHAIATIFILDDHTINILLERRLLTREMLDEMIQMKVSVYSYRIRDLYWHIYI